jgi:hypothetical protein
MKASCGERAERLQIMTHRQILIPAIFAIR